MTDAEGIKELEEDYEPFRQALAEVLGSTIAFFPVESHFQAIPAMLAEQLDLAWAGPSEYLLFQERANAIPVVSLKRPHFRGVFTVRADSNIRSLADLKGKTVDMYKIGSTTSYINATKMLMEAGLEPKSDFTTVTSGTHSLQILEDNEADAMIMTASRYQSVLQKENRSPRDYPIIATSPILPGDVFVAKNQFDTSIIETLRSRMLANQDHLIEGILATPDLAKKFKDASLISFKADDYEAIREVYRALGQEIQ